MDGFQETRENVRALPGVRPQGLLLTGRSQGRVEVCCGTLTEGETASGFLSAVRKQACSVAARWACCCSGSSCRQCGPTCEQMTCGRDGSNGLSARGLGLGQITDGCAAAIKVARPTHVALAAGCVFLRRRSRVDLSSRTLNYTIQVNVLVSISEMATESVTVLTPERRRVGRRWARP